MIVAAMAVIGIMVAGCKSSKPTTVQKEKELANNICEELAEEKPAFRAAGNGIHGMLSTAKNLAENQARAALAKAVQARVEAATKEFTNTYTKQAHTENAGKSISDVGSLSKDLANTYANQCLKNTYVIKTYKTQLANGMYSVWVCVEMQPTNDIASGAADTIRQNIPDADRRALDEAAKSFEEEMRKQFRDKDK